MHLHSRRQFLQQAAVGAAAAGFSLHLPALHGQAATANDPTLQPAGERPPRTDGIMVLNPRARVPVSHIIDDSTCLVNLAHFGIPQFHEVFPAAYRQEWKKLPREIPDSFVRKFGEWSQEQGVKGKYSIVPYPACVGWLDRDLPGWSKSELKESIDLVQKVITPNWDIHPEMISHTRVIDTKTGRAYPEHTEHFMENWRWTDGKSTDQIADYVAYALRILKNIGMPCEGITTPGGFGNRALASLSQGTMQACRDVYQTEIPHYFRHLFTDERSVAPRVEYASGIDGASARCVVSIIGCTGDWFGGWDGITPGSVDKLITEDLKGGRMPEVIRRGEPAIMVCHWPGLYYNGQEIGFNILKEAARRLSAGFDNLVWMKLSEISRYWAAKELTRIEKHGGRFEFFAPFATPLYTVSIKAAPNLRPRLIVNEQPVNLQEAGGRLKLKGADWCRDREDITVCFDLPKGRCRLELV